MEYFAFQWHITEACDQRAGTAIFMRWAATPGSRRWLWRTWSPCLKTAKIFCQKAGRLPYLYITGGDPILHPQFWALMKLLKLSNIPFALMGNPFHLTADVCRRLKDYGCRKYQLSPGRPAGDPRRHFASNPAPTTPPWRPSPCFGTPASTWPL